MPNIQYTAQLDFTDNGTFETGWRIKQGDYGDCEIVFRVVNNGVNMYDADISPDIAFRRSNGTSVVSTMIPNDGTYKYTFVGNELAVPGSTLVDVKYTDAQGRISTASCRFQVVEDTIGYDPTGASTYNNPVSELVAQATEDSLIAEGFAVGQQRGQDVPESSPYYHNNAKYWSEQANPTLLENLQDVSLTSLTEGQTLIYDATNDVWKNGNGGGGASTLAGLLDVDIALPIGGQALVYDDVNDEWINATVPSGSSTLNGLTDVTITTPSNNQVLKYDAANSKWINANESGGGDADDISYDNTSSGLIATNVQDAIDEVNGVWTSAVNGLVGDTSVAFSNAAIATTSTLELFSENTSGSPVVWTAVSVSSGSATYTIEELTEATSFKLWIRNL